MDIEARAREIALAQGHKDPQAIIVCTDGAKVPVWRFYIPAAEAEGVIDLLESNARVQAKLLADTGRERDRLADMARDIS